ncbi:amino acid permease [Methanolobus sp.]|jgi:amino acid transporter/nucleotide-binding universal stress UspA family protein|uniref:amino acid permease n=1 Tax=Methanolobus sp. TaxID=1874737 RepID=UPI0025FFC42D|nr:amino acid permease [Methanolobus sp.]
MAAIETQERLGRSLGFFSTFAIGTGTMIGAGIFILPGVAMANAGPGAIISFMLGGIIAIATAISMSELATGMPSAGGSYYYISRTMGAVFGAIIGLGSWLALIFKGSFALVGLAAYFQIYYQSPPYLIAVAAGLILLVINYRGAKVSGSLQNIIVAMLLVVLVVFIFEVMFSAKPGNFVPVVPYGPVSVLTTTGIIFISYLGLAEISTVAEEVKNPSRNLPLAFIASAVTVTLFYVGIMAAVVGGSIPGQATSMFTPLADIAGLIAGDVGRIVIVVGALFATLSTANGAILSSSRFPFAMSRDALMPKWFITIHKSFKTPSNAILATSIVMILLLFLFDIEQLARLGGAFNVIIFVLLNLAVIILRKRTLPGYAPTFRDPFFPFTQIVGIVGSLMLLPFLGIMPLFFVLVMAFVGVGWFRYYGRGKAIPEYNLFDLLEDTVEQKKVKPESIVKVLVPISNPWHEQDLLKLADCLGSEIIGLHVIKVPDQTSLQVAQTSYHDKCMEIDHHFKKEFDRYPAIVGQKRNYIVAFDHDIANSIIEQAEMENVDTIIMGWHESGKFQYSLGEVASSVFASSKKQILLLKDHLPDKINRILVAYNGKENSIYGFYIARKLAANTGAKIVVLTVISPDEEEEKKKEIAADVTELVVKDDIIKVEFRILEKYSVEDAILDAAVDSDVTIIGDSSRRFKIAMLGTMSQRIAKHSKKPVLIIKKPRPISKESLNNLMKKMGR